MERLNTEIRFGTDGWRAIIDREFTEDKVRLVAQAIAEYFKETGQASGGVVVGYDTRRKSREFAWEVARVLSGNGIHVKITNKDTPTPVVCYHITRGGFSGGIMITASHNPPEYNGIKFIPSHGGPASKEITRRIEELIKEVKEVKLDSNELISVFDPKEPYINFLIEEIGFEFAKKSRLKIIYDPLYGTGRGYVDEILSRVEINVTTIHDSPDPMFGGLTPEPVKKNLEDLMRVVSESKADLGLATDGDADRFAVIEEGKFIHNNLLYPIFLRYFHEKGFKGTIVRTVSTSHLIDAIAKELGFKVREVPVGFKYIAEVMMKENAFFGCEESGGLSISSHLLNKDGIFACCLAVEVRCYMGRSFLDLIDDLLQKYGHRVFLREDLRIDPEKREEIITAVKTKLSQASFPRKIIKISTLDGIKLVFDDESWLLVRPSGTEPLLRIYAEARTEKEGSRLIEVVHNVISQL